MRTVCITILSAIVLQIAVMSAPVRAQNEGMGVLGRIQKDEEQARQEAEERRRAEERRQAEERMRREEKTLATEEKLRKRSRPVEQAGRKRERLEVQRKPQTPSVEASRPGGGGGKSQIGVGF